MIHIPFACHSGTHDLHIHGTKCRNCWLKSPLWLVSTALFLVEFLHLLCTKINMGVKKCPQTWKTASKLNSKLCIFWHSLLVFQGHPSRCLHHGDEARCRAGRPLLGCHWPDTVWRIGDGAIFFTCLDNTHLDIEITICMISFPHVYPIICCPCV